MVKEPALHISARVLLRGNALQILCCRGWCAGEQLSTGWDPILRILEAVPEAEEGTSVGLAFQSVQLLASDYMSALPPSLLRKCLEVAALYGAQQVCYHTTSYAHI